jgi:hypothetical protein
MLPGMDKSEVDEHNFLLDYKNPKLHATNRIRVGAWFTHSETGNHYPIAQIIVSPLPCPTWGALPLSRAQWNILETNMTVTHCFWQWIQAVMLYFHDEDWEVGGIYGWYMEPCKKLPTTEEDGVTNLCVGQAIYKFAVDQYIGHAGEASVTQCQS